MRLLLVDHKEHGLLRLRDDYYARRRALLGGIILASALIAGQIAATRISIGVIAHLVQIALGAMGFAYGLICAAWPNNPRQTAKGIITGTGAFCLFTLGGGILMFVLVLLIAFIPAAAGGVPGLGGALLGTLAVLLGSLAGSIMVVGSAAIICLAGFVTLRVAAGANLDDSLLNETVAVATDKKVFYPVLACVIGAALIGIAATSVLSMGTSGLLHLNRASGGLVALGAGLDYLVGYSDVGIVIASTGSASLSDLFAGLMTVIATAFILGILLALPLAVTARSLMIYMNISGADFSVAHAASLRINEEEGSPPPAHDDGENIADLDLRDAVQRPEGWHPEGGRATKRELLEVKRRDVEVELEQRGSIPGLDD